MLHFLHLQINSSVSSWLQRQNAPSSLQVCYTSSRLQLQQILKPIHGWRAGTLSPLATTSPFLLLCQLCPSPPVLRMKMKHFLCFSQRGAAENVANPSSDNSGQERAPCQASCNSQPTSQGDSEDAAFNRPGSCLRSQEELLGKCCISLLITTTSAKLRC